MTVVAGTPRAWLRRPANTFGGQWLVLFLLLPSPVGFAVGVYYLVSGQVHGGRVAALLILLYAAAATYILVQGWRRGARIWHLVVGVVLAVPVSWIDSWINDPSMHWTFPLWAVLLALGLAHNVTRYVWRSRRRTGPGGSPQVPAPQASAASADSQ